MSRNKAGEYVQLGPNGKSSKWPTVGRIVWTVLGVLSIVLMFWVSFSILNDPTINGRYSETTNKNSDWARLMFAVIGLIAFSAGVLCLFQKGARKMALLAAVVVAVAVWMIILLIPLTETTGVY